MPRDDIEIVPPRTAAGRSLGIEPHPLDTVMIVKRFLWDSEMSQPIQVTIPYEFLGPFLQQAGRTPNELRPPNPVQDAHLWLQCALYLLETQEESLVARSVCYLQDLAAENRGWSRSFPPLNWLHQCIGDHDLAFALRRGCNLQSVLVPGLQTNVHVRRL